MARKSIVFVDRAGPNKYVFGNLKGGDVRDSDTAAQAVAKLVEASGGQVSADTVLACCGRELDGTDVLGRIFDRSSTLADGRPADSAFPLRIAFLGGPLVSAGNLPDVLRGLLEAERPQEAATGSLTSMKVGSCVHEGVSLAQLLEHGGVSKALGGGSYSTILEMLFDGPWDWLVCHVDNSASMLVESVTALEENIAPALKMPGETPPRVVLCPSLLVDGIDSTMAAAKALEAYTEAFADEGLDVHVAPSALACGFIGDEELRGRLVTAPAAGWEESSETAQRPTAFGTYLLACLLYGVLRRRPAPLPGSEAVGLMAPSDRAGLEEAATRALRDAGFVVEAMTAESAMA